MDGVLAAASFLGFVCGFLLAWGLGATRSRRDAKLLRQAASVIPGDDAAAVQLRRALFKAANNE